ncbi:MAG: hypothetical protein L3K17_06285 [Thermoplasmata archaeon]|nr:hypothetical protein [Thermoplasmata archaeon]
MAAKAKSQRKGTRGKKGRTTGPRRSPPKGFVGRDSSPVLERYPPKDPSLTLRAPAPLPPAAPVAARPSPPAAPAGTLTPPPPAPAAGAPAPKGLITLERPFDADEFSQLLGETIIRVMVPKEDLGEVLRRITDFMGFGIYVYALEVRPAAEESLRRFQVELRRVDFSPSAGHWVPFEETGRSESPFGPGARQ